MQELAAAGVVGLGHGLQALRVLLVEAGFQGVDQRVVEGVEPDHGGVALVGVVVPVPAGGEEQVAGGHEDPFAVDRGPGAVAFEDEAEGVGGVPVGLRGLAGQDDLQARVEGVDRGRGVGQAGVDEHQDPSFGFLQGQGL